jgi:hypothetical protein
MDNKSAPQEGPIKREDNKMLESKSTIPGDLPDTKQDQEKLENEETIIDLPDVKDIPGQEFVKAPPTGALGDTTIASDDEEGVGVFDTDDVDDLTEGTEFDVTEDEKETLADTEYMPSTDEDNLKRARMDSTDFDNDPLNEKSFGEELSGDDLDIDDGTGDTENDAMGQGDEENKLYSLDSDNNDDENDIE